MKILSQRKTFINASLCIFLGAALAASIANTAHAQGDYPSRALKIVVPYPAGAGSDAMARAIADKLQKSWGQPVIVENRTGASGTIGNQYVVKAPADGYTLLYSNTSLIQQPWMMSKLPYDPLKNLAPLVIVSASTTLWLYQKSIPRPQLSKSLLNWQKPTQESTASGAGALAVVLTFIVKC
ncbi:hypothetical protein LP416_10015 [Polaromonas sp. P2-4]|nr:hypothetical protein LP416_10015 [Polaromonas sp. P2-4]